MNVLQLIPQPSFQAGFNFINAKFIPKVSGCYVLTTFDNNILYIGKTKNLNDRFKDHLNDNEKTSPTEYGKALLFYYELVRENELLIIERTWINKFVSEHGHYPILNKISSPLL